MKSWHAGALAPLLLVAGCGDLPMPFKNNPGDTALRLAAPPPTRLAVPQSGATLLENGGAALWSRDLASALDDQSVPAEAITPARGDWRLVATARLAGEQVIPHYAVYTPQGMLRGAIDGAPVSASAWSNADPATLQRVAQAAAPDIVTLLTGIRAEIRAEDPHSILHRPAKIYFPGVKGAPGDGDTALAQNLRTQLAMRGDVVQSAPSGADYTVTGTVGVASPKDGTQAVDIEWHVVDDQGHEAGNVSQLNAVPVHALDGAWGDVALAAATEAAGGIHEVIANNSGRNDKRVKPPKS